ncbi:MAG: hypothetical protein P1P64_06490 [Treponemataceae bacterium]
MEKVNSAAQILITVLPIVAVVSVSILVFFFLLWRHREIMCQIKTNTYNPSVLNLKVFSLFTGILLCAVGLVLTIIFIIATKNIYALLGGLIPLALGIGLLIFYNISKKNKDL